MKTAIRITGIHFLLITLLWILANIDTASWCSGTCDTASYFGVLAFLFFVYPGLMLATQLIPYIHSAPDPITVLLASAIATEAMLFILIFVLTKILHRNAKHERA